MTRNFFLRTPFMLLPFIAALDTSAQQTTPQNATVRLVTLDPGHFHAALVQKSMYPQVSPVVQVYAPETPDVKLHLARIQSYNKRADKPTSWDEKVYIGPDYLEKMLADKRSGATAGNVVVIAGNNQKKTEYIQKSIDAGFNVLADKPMVIDARDFDQLRTTFTTAAQKNVLLYDIMTERSEITTLLQRELSMIPSVFGTLEKGTPDNPAVTKESVHHFYKYVSGSVLQRPGWFMDVTQQGEGIVDVTTHLVDLVQWECFPEQIIDYKKDIRLNSARRWTTDMTRSQFKTITNFPDFPDYLKREVVNDSLLKIYSNGEINYQLRGVNAKVSVIWAYKAPEGGGDTHYSIIRGTKANLVIRQGAEQKYTPALYIEPITTNAAYESSLTAAVNTLQQRYPGVSVKKNDKGWEVIIPEKYNVGHEAHFSQVTENFLKYLQAGKLPAWEVPNMIAKYYTTTQALKLAKESKTGSPLR
ncbi:putative oxidoreductase C-terminal domain-containing protein [Spirosoma pomorum]